MSNKTDTKRFKQSDEDAEMSRKISSAIAQKKKGKRKKKKNNELAIGAGITAAVLLLGAVIYVGGWVNSTGKFLANTYINGIDVSKMTPKQAASAIQVEPTTEYLTVTGRGGTTERIPVDYFDYKFDIYSEVMSLFNQIDYSSWVSALFNTTNYEVNSEAQYSSDKLEYVLRNTIWGSTDTSDAKMLHGDDGYYIQPEVYGDTVNTDKLVNYVMGCVENGILNVNLSESDCYTDPPYLLPIWRTRWRK